jgi:hypothetical protein
MGHTQSIRFVRAEAPLLTISLLLFLHLGSLVSRPSSPQLQSSSSPTAARLSVLATFLLQSLPSSSLSRDPRKL